MLTASSILNYAAQLQLTPAWAQQWFMALPPEARQDALLLLKLFVHQSHPTPTMVQQAIAAQPARPFTTPMALLTAHPFQMALHKICALPLPEHPNAFRVLLAIFTIADTHRRTHSCRDNCSHDWHHLPPLPERLDCEG